MTSLSWVKNIIASNIIWKLCEDHRFLVVADRSGASERCRNCGSADGVSVYELRCCVTRAGYTRYMYGQEARYIAGFATPLRTCVSCAIVIAKALDDDDDCFNELQTSETLPTDLVSIVMAYVYTAIVKCPFHV